MADVTTTITYTERFYHDVRVRYNVPARKETSSDGNGLSEGFATYQEAVEDAARYGIATFEIRKIFVKVTA